MLKEYRLKHNLTQKEMASLLNLKLSTYKSYELSKREIPYKVLIDFLTLRNKDFDKELMKILKEVTR